MKGKGSLLIIIPLVLNIVADMVNDYQRRIECREMVKEEVEKALNER